VQQNDLFVTRDRKNRMLENKAELEANWDLRVCSPIEAVAHFESYRLSRRANSLRGCSRWHEQVDIHQRYESGPFAWSKSTVRSTPPSGPRSRRLPASWAARPKPCAPG